MAAYLTMWLMRIVDTKKFTKIRIDWKSISLSIVVIALQIVGLYFVENTYVFLLEKRFWLWLCCSYKGSI